MTAKPTWLAEGYPHVWLPYTQMQTAAMPEAAVVAEGCRIKLADGRELIDGTTFTGTILRRAPKADALTGTVEFQIDVPAGHLPVLAAVAPNGEDIDMALLSGTDVLAIDHAQGGPAVLQEGGEAHGGFRWGGGSEGGREQHGALRRLQPVTGRGRDAPLVDPPRRPGPIRRLAGPVGFVDLLDLGRVLDDDAEGVDEVVEGVVAGAVAAGAPFDGVAGVLHAAAAVRHRVQRGHHQGDGALAVVPRCQCMLAPMSRSDGGLPGCHGAWVR